MMSRSQHLKTILAWLALLGLLVAKGVQPTGVMLASGDSIFQLCPGTPSSAALLALAQPRTQPFEHHRSDTLTPDHAGSSTHHGHEQHSMHALNQNSHKPHPSHHVQDAAEHAHHDQHHHQHSQHTQQAKHAQNNSMPGHEHHQAKSESCELSSVLPAGLTPLNNVWTWVRLDVIEATSKAFTLDLLARRFQQPLTRAPPSSLS